MEHENNYHSTPNTDDFVSKPIQSPYLSQKSAHTHKTNTITEPEKPQSPDLVRSMTAKSTVVEMDSKKPNLIQRTKNIWQ
jgi:hypothetical protein